MKVSDKQPGPDDVIPDNGGKGPRDVIPDSCGKDPYDVIPDNGVSSPCDDFPDGGKDPRGATKSGFPTQNEPSEFCFPPGTQIEMADGSLRPIEETRVGDRVRSWDVRRGLLAEGSVVRALAGTTGWLIRLNGCLSASPAHRILSTRGYLRFDEVERGDLLLRSSGSSPELVTIVEIIPGDHRVHNLVVVPHASFIAEGLLVEDQDGEEVLVDLGESRVAWAPLGLLTSRQERQAAWSRRHTGAELSLPGAPGSHSARGVSHASASRVSKPCGRATGTAAGDTEPAGRTTKPAG
jgi:hypothetical protein